MKKSLLYLLIFTSLLFTGCKKASKELLAYQTAEGTLNHSIYTQLTEGDFFAKDITVISEEENKGQDQLLTSGATLLIDITNNKVHYADQVYQRMYPASLTKLVTALVVLRYGELTDLVTIGSNALRIADKGAKVCGFDQGEVITLEALLNCMLIYSGNDAAIAIAEHIGQSEEEFAALMNDEARKIGAVQSNFMNCHGLHDDNQYTTAYDMYLVMNELLSYDTFQNMINTKEYQAVYQSKNGTELKKTFKTTNDYLSGAEVITSGFEVVGGISGSTSKAGKCMILFSKDEKETKYLSLILNAPDNETLYSQMNHLLTK